MFVESSVRSYMQLDPRISAARAWVDQYVYCWVRSNTIHANSS